MNYRRLEKNNRDKINKKWIIIKIKCGNIFNFPKKVVKHNFNCPKGRKVT